MNKNLLVIILTFYSLSTIGQANSAAESERLFERDIEIQREQSAREFEQTLKSIENQREQEEDIVKKYAKGSEFRENSEPETDPWTQAIERLDKKVQLGGFSKIKDSELYVTLSDGTRRAKYPYVPSWATSIEEVEQYFKEHPSELDNFKDKENQSVSSNEYESYSNNESYSENRYENELSNPIGIIAIATIICFLIAEFIGRRKHIGRWWSFLLLLSGLIPGIIAIMVSPSAKNSPTIGGKSYSIWGWILIVFGILNLMIFAGSNGNSSVLFYIFFVLSYYLFELSKGKIKNAEPKFYF